MFKQNIDYDPQLSADYGSWSPDNTELAHRSEYTQQAVIYRTYRKVAFLSQ